MEQELRFGKFTDDEVERILTNALLPYEQENLKKGLSFLGLTFQEYFFCKDQLIMDEADAKINMLELSSHSLISRINEKLANATLEQIALFDKFNLTVLNVLFLNTKFLQEIGQEQVAIAGYESILKNNEELRKRFLQEFPEEKLGESFIRMKEELDELKNSKGKLIWNGNPIVLKRLSEELANKNITEHIHDFSNVFDFQNTCVIKKSEIDFFLVLMYNLVFEKDSNNEENIINDSGKNWGSIGIAENYFWYKSKSGLKKIDFRSRMYVLQRKRTHLIETEGEVKTLLKTIF